MRAFAAVVIALLAARGAGCAEKPTSAPETVVPHELTEAVLHNPDMGWVVYENYPLDQDPKSSSTMLTLPNEDFPGVDTVALMFSWQDIEHRPGEYDFSKVDFAYDYWTKRGKAIQLRVSSATLMWWATRTPPAGIGTPEYVLAKLAPNEKQTRDMYGTAYAVEDARNPYYRERLAKFLKAMGAHYSSARPVTLVDLRGFGAWGEWHSGFKYPTVEDRHSALKAIIDIWCAALPNHRLALSGSYDPDGPKEFYAGSTKKFDERWTSNHADYLHYSAFDYALTKENITWRRDGCGGAVHSNERKLNDEAFRLGRGPMFSEFVDGYSQSKVGGQKWVDSKIDDALSLHPNYINLLGWQGGDALTFLHERPDLVDSGLRRMGYRFVPTRVELPATILSGRPCEFEIDWINRGVGRALRDYEVQLSLLDSAGHVAATASGGPLHTSQWVAGQKYVVPVKVTFENMVAGKYELAIALHDLKLNRQIVLPLAQITLAGSYRIAKMEVVGDRRPAPEAVK